MRKSTNQSPLSPSFPRNEGLCLVDFLMFYALCKRLCFGLKAEKIMRNCLLRPSWEKARRTTASDSEKRDATVYHLDHFGLLPSIRKNYRHVLMVVDAFTKFVWLYAIKTTNTVVLDCKETVNHFWKSEKDYFRSWLSIHVPWRSRVLSI